MYGRVTEPLVCYVVRMQALAKRDPVERQPNRRYANGFPDAPHSFIGDASIPPAP
jgi:hypothetical protein